MGMSGTGAVDGGPPAGKRRRRGVMSEINVTPHGGRHAGVAHHLHGLGARCLTVGVPIDPAANPQAQGAWDQDKEPLTLVAQWRRPRSSCRNSEIGLEEAYFPSSRAISDAQRRAVSTSAFMVRGDHKVDYGTVMKVMGAHLRGAGFPPGGRWLTEVEQGP